MGMVISSLWRYPVKSMRGEQLGEALLREGGLAGDREYAFESSGAPPGMLRLTGGERREMLRFQALREDETTYVWTPAGERLAVDDLTLMASLPGTNNLTLTWSARPQTDCRPLALISNLTIDALSSEMGQALDARRFRANLYLDVEEPFAEDQLVGQTIRVGADAVIRVTERDPRCRFITLDPETLERLPELMKLLDRRHQGRAGVYATVVNPGVIRPGDRVG